MATQESLNLAQTLYVAYYGRPADRDGLNYWAEEIDANGVDAMVNAFGNSAEFDARFGDLTTNQLINNLYQQMFGRSAELAGLDFYAGQLASGESTLAEIALDIANGAQNEDATALSNKVAVAADFTAAIDTSEEVLAYAGDAAANSARDFLATVDAETDVATVDVDAQLSTMVQADQDETTVGETFSLTAGIDNLTGNANDDTFNAPTTDGATPVKTLGGLDSINGGAGTDTLNVDDTATASTAAFTVGTATIENVENVNIATTGTLGAAGTALDLSGMTGATKVNLKSQDTGATAHNIKVANDVDLTVAVGAGTADTVGGKVVSVAAPGVVTVAGDALTNVTVKGAASTSDVTNTVAGAGAAGKTLESVTFDKIAAGTATAKGDALNSITLKNQDAALVTSLTNTATESLTVNVENAGYNATTKALVAGVAVDASTTANYKTVAVNSTGVNQLTLTAADATAVKATGAGNITLTLAAAAATSFDGTAATGNIALNGFAAGMTDIKTGAGKDTFTTVQTAKSTFDTGAGNDAITAASALAAGTTVNLGAGDDKLLFATGGSVVNSTATATTVIDGGEGSDTLALELVGAANVGVFTNFEVFDVVGMSNKTLDLDILAANNTVAGLVGSGVTTGAATLTNVGAGVGFTAVENMIAAGTTTVKTAPVAGANEVVTLTQKTAGAMTVKVDSDSTSTTVANDAAVSAVATNATSLKAEFASDSGFAQTVGAVATENNQAIVLEGTKAATLEVVSGGTNATNLLSYTIGADAAVAANGILTSATVSGSEALTLDFALKAGVTVNKLATVNASEMTGSLTVDLADIMNAGTVKLGSGADVVKAGGVITTSADIESVEGFAKAASKEAEAVKVADILDFTTAATVGTEATPSTDVDVAKGVVTFLGTGPTTLDAAIGMVDAAVTAANAAVAFEYIGNTYVYQQGGATSDITDDFVVKLAGVADVTELGVNAASDVFLV
ncbi:beta strand repeat-containing protein [Vreelandella arctica]|uniref:beta strand repeat-containing protein n=1 Tax=Vreelandella arctica TaxID=3126499 RepID=UPI00300DF8D1